jgi:HIRAN domain
MSRCRNGWTAMFDTAIVGTKFRGTTALAALAALRKGTRLTIKREPNNPADQNAVAVFLGDQHLGYVPRADNVELAQTFIGLRASALIVEVIAEAIIDGGEIKFAPKIRIRRNQ